MLPKQIAIVGATGSIGRQAIEVIEQSDVLRLSAFSFHTNLAAAEEAIRRHQPDRVVTTDPAVFPELLRLSALHGFRPGLGADAVCEMVSDASADIVLTSVVGDVGILPTVAAIRAGKTIALANKETLVAAGDLIMPLATACGATIIPVDSEHSAIDQCLQGHADSVIEKLWLTASGGAFRSLTREEIASKQARDALRHPNWSMGAKITIDSATLMNKGLELIEAMHLFRVAPQDIEIRIHPQSIVHSMVQFTDGCVLAQLGRPDMREPIAYALHGRRRRWAGGDRLTFLDLSLTFSQPDPERFPALKLAREAAERRGTAPGVLSAANEIAVDAYLRDEIGFYQITDLVETTLRQIPHTPLTSFDDLAGVLTEARAITKENLCRFHKSSALR